MSMARTTARLASLSGELDRVKFGTQMSRVHQRLELPQRRGLRFAFHFQQPVASDLSEPAALVTQKRLPPTKRLRRFRHRGEIDMRGDVGLPRCREWIVASPVL